MQNNFKKFFGLGILLIIFSVSTSFYTKALGGVTDNISGYAWEADNWVDRNSNNVVDFGEVMTNPGGTEWISFNCKDDTSCAQNYGVNVNTTTGDLSGYAWSSHYGWLSFNVGSPFPSGGGTISEGAKINFNLGSQGARPVTGWARFCSVLSSTDCTGTAMKPNPQIGGWDGWVSFSGTSPNYGVYLDMSSATKAFSGYAWGGNSNGSNTGKNVLGWISFNSANGGGGASYKVLYTPAGTPTVNLSATSLGGNSYRLDWTGQNLLAGANNCTAGGDSATGWNTGSTHPSPIGNSTLDLANETYNFTISCVGDPAFGGGTVTDNVTVIAGIDLSFTADSNIVYATTNYTTTLYWDVFPSNATLTDCVPTSSPTVSAWNNVSIKDIPPSGSTPVTVPPNSNPTTFTLTCHDGGNTIVKSIPLNRGTLPESLALTNSVVTETSPGSGSYITNLTWTTQNIRENSCVATLGGSNWPGAKTNPQTGSTTQDGVIVPGSTSPPAPLINTTYTLTCIRLNIDNQTLCPAYSGDTTKICTSIILNQNSGNVSNIVKPKFKEN